MFKYLLIFLSFIFFSQAQQIVAHRGASHDAPENTIPAFKLAWEKGADYIEADFLLTADKKIICTHDKKTKKFSKTNLTVEKSLSTDLMNLDVGSWKGAKFKNTRMPLLAEVIATIPKGKGFLLEIKSGINIVPYLKTELENIDLSNIDLQIICFDLKILKACHKALPNIKTQWLKSVRKPNMGSLAELIKQAKANGVSGIATNMSVKFLPKDSQAQLKAAGITLNVWTVNSPKTAQALAPHVDYITTDRPRLVRDASSKNHK
jgi:glycerophosphoryl diester phosphodiesterase